MRSLPAPARRSERDLREEAGDTALGLLDMMAGPGLLPQERALAADTLLHLLPRMAEPQLIRLAERVALMDSPPPLLAAKLIRDIRPDVMIPVLERNLQVPDLELISASSLSDVERLRILVRRRTLSPVLSSYVAASGDPAALLGLLRNPGAQMSYDALASLCAEAAHHPSLLALLVSRADLPAAVAFELYWSLPPELRRLLLSRFLTESAALARILRIALAEDGGLHTGALREERPAATEDVDAALALASADIGEAARHLAALVGLEDGTVRRILDDPHGEPAAVLFKVMGLSRPRFVEATERLRGDGRFADVSAEDLQNVYDSFSFTKARVLLTYWDWFIRRAGPYGPRL
jgi:uncharacterized protein (DUF2336 family)